MKESLFYSDAVIQHNLNNREFSTVSTHNSGGGFLNKAGNFFKQIAIGIDAANQNHSQQYAMQNPLYNFNQMSPQQQQAMMAYGYNQQRNNTLLWVVGGVIVIGGIAYLAKENLDD